MRIEGVGDIDWAVAFYVAICAAGGAVVGALPGMAVMGLVSQGDNAKFLLGGGFSAGGVVGAIAGSAAVLAKTMRASRGSRRHHRGDKSDSDPGSSPNLPAQPNHGHRGGEGV